MLFVVFIFSKWYSVLCKIKKAVVNFKRVHVKSIFKNKKRMFQTNELIITSTREYVRVPNQYRQRKTFYEMKKKFTIHIFFVTDYYYLSLNIISFNNSLNIIYIKIKIIKKKKE